MLFLVFILGWPFMLAAALLIALTGTKGGIR